MERLKRAIDLRGAVAINVITMIGIGPLVTIPLVLATLGGPLALLGWIAGAIVALCDGLVWAELSSRFPGSGGTYVYLRETFGAQRLGRACAFLFNWQLLLYAPCLLASGYIALADYAAYIVPAIASNGVLHDAVAVGSGVLTIALLYRKTAHVAAVGTALAVAAALTIALIAIAALTHAHPGQAFHLDAPVRFGAGLLAGFGGALFVTLYDYTGYADAALLGDEVVRPERTIPRSIVISVLLVAALYICLQIGVLGVVPWHSLLGADGQPTPQAQYVGSLVVERTWGQTAAWIVTLLVLVTAFASLYGNLLGFSRIPFAAARDGAFIPAFAKLHERKHIPSVALLAIGGLSLVASLFTLGQVIAVLTAGIVIVQGVGQIVALGVLRLRGERAPFRMPFFPLPAIVALAGWLLAFACTGATAIALGLGWLAVGALVFLAVARARRWWPFAALLVLALGLPASARAAGPAPSWSTWNASAVTQERGYPVFTVDGKAFFVYGAAFFYERLPRSQWRSALQAYRMIGINTLDLYVIWNWHQPSQEPPDFTGATDPRRDLVGLLQLAHALGFKVILRPGPVIRNEWRNGGYPAWLLSRPEYRMPLHDVLEGRYPATATLQNAQADAAADEWLHNSTHLTYAAQWLRAVLAAVAPYSHDIIAIALDDDQGAYLDNDTWPAPHWHAYVGWLRATVQSSVGTRVPLFINTFESKITAAAPAWAWGDWYQSDAFRIGEHDLTQLDFATGLLQTQPHVPVMLAEFQAGWLQGADEAAPRPSDPTNTALALGELLRDGAHGIVNFPVQDTIFPDGWEAPWANWSYAWDAALTYDLHESPRYAPTAAFGEDVRRYGALLARTHRAADAAIVWPATLFAPQALGNADFGAFADATIAAQHECAALALTCDLVDLRYADAATLTRYRAIVLPGDLPSHLAASVDPAMHARIDALRRGGRLVRDLSKARFRPRLTGTGAVNATLLLADDDSYGFVVATNPGDLPRVLGPLRVQLSDAAVTLPVIALPARSVQLVPVRTPAVLPPPSGVFSTTWQSAPPWQPPAGSARIVEAPLFTDGAPGIFMENARIRVAFAPEAGARIALLQSAIGGGDAATSIGLLRDGVDPVPAPSARDYIAAYTHPLPAGTFNRAYVCTSAPTTATHVRESCAYDAPDLPDGGARFERTLSLDAGSTSLTVDESFAPHDPASTARLASISGLAVAPGDTLIAPPHATFVAVLRGDRVAWIAWRAGDVARIVLEPARGAELVTLVFSRRSVQLRVGAAPAADQSEALRLLRANSAPPPG